MVASFTSAWSYCFVTIKRAKAASAANCRRANPFNFRHDFENLRAFDEFPSEKLLVRYEDLVIDFSEFLEAPEIFVSDHHKELENRNLRRAI